MSQIEAIRSILAIVSADSSKLETYFQRQKNHSTNHHQWILGIFSIFKKYFFILKNQEYSLDDPYDALYENYWNLVFPETPLLSTAAH